MASHPPEMAATFVKPRTGTGSRQLVSDPLPHWPSLFSPQAMTVPLDMRARLKNPPAEREAGLVSPMTCTGMLVPWPNPLLPLSLKATPMPNSPYSLRPQAQTVPSVSKARV